MIQAKHPSTRQHDATPAARTGCSDTRVASMATSTAAAPTAELTLLIDGYLAGAIIGKGGSTLKSIKSSSGVLTLQLSQESSVATRTVSVTGHAAALHEAYRLIAQALRAEAEKARRSGCRPSDAARLLVPNGLGAQLLAKQGAGVRKLRRASDASIELEAHPATPKHRLLRCSGTEAQTATAVRLVVDMLSEREGGRHRAFLSYWPFETNYNDHFETPQAAYADVLPLLSACARQAHGDGAGLETLRVYDPYYCQGAMQRALAALGCARDNLINENRDFYADVAAGTLPPHDVLLTNPPYSADHKQRLLAFLLAQQGILSQPSTAGQGVAGRGAAGSALSGSGGNGDDGAANTNSAAAAGGAAGGAAAGGRPFLLLVPAWMAATDYWAAFVAALGRSRADAAPAAAPAEGGKRGTQRKRVCRADAAERRAGVFYISPCERCAARPFPPRRPQRPPTPHPHDAFAPPQTARSPPHTHHAPRTPPTTTLTQVRLRTSTRDGPRDVPLPRRVVLWRLGHGTAAQGGGALAYLLPTTTYYYLLLPTTSTYYYLLLPTTTYYYLLLPTITCSIAQWRSC